MTRDRITIAVTACALACVLAIVLFYADSTFNDRCHDIGGEWHTWRGCKVVNIKGVTQWVKRP